MTRLKFTTRDQSLSLLLLPAATHSNFITSNNLQTRASVTVWPDLANFRHFSNILKVFDDYVRAYLVLGTNLNLLWSAFYAIGQFFIVANGLILTNNLAICSHWSVGPDWAIFKDLCAKFCLMLAQPYFENMTYQAKIPMLLFEQTHKNLWYILIQYLVTSSATPVTASVTRIGDFSPQNVISLWQFLGLL